MLLLLIDLTRRFITVNWLQDVDMNKLIIGSTLVGVLLFFVMPLSSYAASYQITKVEKWDSLNIREGAFGKSKVIGKIPYNGKGIVLTNKRKKNGRTVWVQVKWKGIRGWVSKRYLIPESTGAQANASKKAAKTGSASLNKGRSSQAYAVDPELLAAAKAFEARKVEATENVVGNSQIKEVRKPQASKGQWILQCGNKHPTEWVIQVFPKHLSVNISKKVALLPITRKHQEKSVWNTALKTIVKANSQAHHLSMDITYTKNCMDSFLEKKVPFVIKANYNGKSLSGCCRSVRLK